MKDPRGFARLQNACRNQNVHVLLEHYIQSCYAAPEDPTTPKKKKTSPYARFPNLAGFCRQLRIGSRELERLADEFPDQIDKIYLALEDEALNSGLAPALLSAYLKRRLGYEKEFEKSEEPTVSVCFEHDIYGDGQ